MRKKVFYIFLILFSLFNFSISGAINMEFKTIKLNNGATVKYLHRDNIPIVYLSVLIPASPLDEEKPSQAYLTAHLLTHGTKNLSAREIEDKIDFFALSIEKKVHYDYTLLTLSTTKRYLSEGLDLFFEILKAPTFPEDEFKKEVSILEKSLKQMEEDPSYIAHKNFLKKLFGEHPYGRPIEGEPEKLKDLTRQDILKFYEKFYKPNRMIFSFVGDINEKELKDKIEKYILPWQGEFHDRQIVPHVFQKRDKPLELKINRKDLTQSTIVLGFEGISRKDPDFFATSLMNYVLGGGGLTSRLAKRVREEKGLAYSIYSTFTPYLLNGAFYIEVKTKAENTDNVVKMIIEELKNMVNNGLKEEELKEAKAFLVGSFPLRIDTMKKLNEFLPLMDFYQLGEDYIKKYPEYIEKVSIEDIKRVSERIINYKSFILIVVGPSN